MAERRMFAKTIVNSDAFTDMPLRAQALYLHIAIEADDLGFVNNPKAIRRSVGASEDDLRLLVAKRFLIAFDNGIVAVKHWWVNNYIQADRRHQTKYQDELSMLFVDENKSYTFADTGRLAAETFSRVSRMDTKCIQNVSKVDTSCIQPVSKMDTEVRLGKDRLGESSNSSRVDTQPNPKEDVQAKPAPRAEKPKHKTVVKHQRGVHANVKLTDEEMDKLKARFPGDYLERIDQLSWYLATHDVRYKSHYLVILNWARQDEKKNPKQHVDQQSLDAFDYAVGLGKGIA